MPEKGSASWQSAPFDAGLSLLRRPMRLCVFHCGKKSGLTVDLPRWSDGSLVVVCESNECEVQALLLVLGGRLLGAILRTTSRVNGERACAFGVPLQAIGPPGPSQYEASALLTTLTCLSI